MKATQILCKIKSDLNEWNDAETKAEAENPPKRGEKLHRSHPDASLQLCREFVFNEQSLMKITHDSLLAKEDVQYCQIFFPGIVGVCIAHILKNNNE